MSASTGQKNWDRRTSLQNFSLVELPVGRVESLGLGRGQPSSVVSVAETHLFRPVIPANGDAGLPFPLSAKRSVIANANIPEDAPILRDVALEHLSNDRPARVVRITEVQPVGQADGPALEVHLVHDFAVPQGDAEHRDPRPSITLSGVQRSGVPRPCREAREVVGRIEWRHGWVRRRERMVEPL